MTANTNPLSYNQYIQQIAAMAVVQAVESQGVYQFVDAPLQTITPSMLNYAELRIQRDLDLLPARASNTYTCTAGQNVLSIPIDDFFTIETVQYNPGTGGNSPPLVPTSREFIQNVYGGGAAAGPPQYFAMIGDNFGDGADTYNNILLGPTPPYPFTIVVNGMIRTPSLYSYASAGPADTSYTYISSYYPDLLIMASMVYISAYQRQFSATSDDPAMGMTYEKQYQALRLGAVPEEGRKRQQGSGWSAYSTPPAATPTR